MAKVITRVGIEEDGKVIVAPGEFDEIIPAIFDNGEVSDKLFLVKDLGEEDILLITDEYEDGYVRYGNVDGIGFINKNCIAVSDYDERHGKKWALLKTDTLDKVTDYSYDNIGLINEDMYITKKDGLYGVIDKNGEAILTNKFTEITFEEAHNTFVVKLFNPDN